MGSLETKPVDERFFESFIQRAIKKECYIEVISLVHNTIEIYLKSLIMQHFIEKKKDSTNYYLERRDIFGEKSNINSLILWAEVCYLFELISKENYKQIKDFNSKRNQIVHKLLKSNDKKTYQEIKKVARLGRIIQLNLSPLDHDEQAIERIMYYFDNPDKIQEKDYNWLEFEI